MNSKAILVPFVALLAIFVVSFASAFVDSSAITTSVNDIVLGSGTTPIAGITGDTVPVRVSFLANSDESDVRVKIWLEGYRDEVSASTSRFNLVDGSFYTKLLSLKLPSDINEVSKDFTLHVTISTAEDLVLKDYSLRLQRDSYSFNILSIDYNEKASAGETIPVAVVVENNGFENADNGFVIVSIPELGVSSKGYFGDLVAVENCSDNCDAEDALQKTVSLKIPDNAVAGVYTLSVKVYNKDASATVNKQIVVDGSASTIVLAAVKNQDIKAGETKTYDLLIVNSGSKVKVYNIQTVSGTALSVSAPAVVTVGPQSSTTVPITVTASNKADKGSYTFSVNVDGQQVVFGANVTSSAGFSNSVVALTVVLVIIFVVLLIVLIVLLSRKEKPSEEVETSYY